jgi:pimeloyl-ACP methyl ester carboxylesterase
LSPVLPALLRSRSYRTARTFTVRTEDGERLTGARIGRDGPALVFCHGFLGWHRKDRIVTFVERLAEKFRVYAIDLRGHGASTGVCTFGDREMLDVDAAVSLARGDAEGLVVTVGLSMGGIAALRQAAFRDGVNLVVAISSPARWDGHTSRAVAQMRWLSTSDRGRSLARAIGARITTEWGRPEDPEAVVERISPTPVILVHGRDDRIFDEEEAWRLYRRASRPKRLMLGRPFGHAEDGLSASFADRLGDRILSLLQG